MFQSRVNDAVRYNTWGYNCAQAIACTYIDLLGGDIKEAFKAMEAFGGGMGCKMGSCGALSGAMYLIGFKKSGGDLSNDPSLKTKTVTYALASKFYCAFIEKEGFGICKDLKMQNEGIKTCKALIKETAELVEDIIFEGEFVKGEMD